MVARQAHNLKVGGSTPSSASKGTSRWLGGKLSSNERCNPSLSPPTSHAQDYPNGSTLGRFRYTISMQWEPGQKEFIKTAWEELIHRFAVPITRTNFVFREQDKEDEGGISTDCEVETGFPYHNCLLIVYPTIIESGGDVEGSIILTLLHELQHVILSPVVENRILADRVFNNYEEGVCEFYAGALWGLIKKDFFTHTSLHKFPMGKCKKGKKK